jgi:NADPH:quinone reductase-like Zn-dependent oxidoreductase
MALRRVLTPKGIYVGAGVLGVDASMIRMLSGMFNGALLSLFNRQKFVSFVTKSNTGDLPVLADLIEGGKIKPVIDRTFRLDGTEEAVRYIAGKHARGKVVISVQD